MLRIERDKGDPGILTPSMIKTASKVNHQKVKAIYLENVNVGKCCEELFRFLSKFTNCTELVIKTLIGDKDKIMDLPDHLSRSIKNLKRLIHINIQDTNLSEGWKQVLSSIKSTHIRVLTLYNDDLDGQGEELKQLLFRLPHLKWLELGNTGLKESEMLKMLWEFGDRETSLQVLMVCYHDLSQCVSWMLKILQRLPKIRILNIEGCKLPGDVVREILEQINPDIEVLLFDRNQPVDLQDLSSVFKRLGECQSLQYLTVSKGQFTDAALSQLASSLSAHGGHVLVDDTRCDNEWENLIKLLDRIHEEC